MHAAAVVTFWGVLTGMDRRVARITRGARGSVVFVMECPTVEAEHDLEKHCASGGRLVQQAQKVIMEDPKFQAFKTADVKVSVQLKGGEV